jgi:hypothetical protein
VCFNLFFSIVSLWDPRFGFLKEFRGAHHQRFLSALTNVLNFIPTPCVIMNEIFHEPTKHNHSKNVIHMFTLHICPMATKRSCQHCNKINTWTIREISNSDVILFVIKKNIVNSSIPRWWNIRNGKNNALEK